MTLIRMEALIDRKCWKLSK